MAEFSEVMRQWRRFCKSHNNCGGCEFDGKGICGEAQLTDIPYADIELRIMSWAAEHPEPVYPTWYEYLEKVFDPEVTKYPDDAEKAKGYYCGLSGRYENRKSN